MSPAYKIILNSHLKTQKWGEKWLKKKKKCAARLFKILGPPKIQFSEEKK